MTLHPTAVAPHELQLRAAFTAYQVQWHLDYLAWAWPDLVEFRLHGTERHWTQTASAPEAARAAAAAQARLELLERTGLAPGQRPAPLRVDVLDLINVVVLTTSELTGALRDVLEGTPCTPPPTYQLPALDARPWLLWCRRVLQACHDIDERTAPWAEHLLEPLVRKVAHTLGDVVEGQTLVGLCPWCGGRSLDGLEGTPTLRVRYPDFGEAGEPMVVCTGWACEPPGLSKAFRTSAGEPAWAPTHWEHLAARLEPLP